MILSHVRTLAFTTLACSAAWLGAGDACAQSEASKGQARELGQKGVSALEHQDWAGAESLFKQAEALYHAPTLTLGLARAEAHLSKFVEAWEAYHRIIVEVNPQGAPPAVAQALADAKVEIETVAGRRAQVTLRITGSDQPQIKVDGESLPPAALGAERPINPGKHLVRVEAAGFKPAEGSFSVDEGKSTVFELTLEPAPAPTEAPSPPPAASTAPDRGGPDGGGGGGSTKRTLGLVGLGVGGAGIVVGAVTGGLALGKHSDLASSPCAGNPCSAGDASSFDSTLSSFHTLSTISTIGFIAGGVLAAGGAFLFFTAPHAPQTPQQESGGASQARLTPTVTPTVTPLLGIGSVGVAGVF